MLGVVSRGRALAAWLSLPLGLGATALGCARAADSHASETTTATASAPRPSAPPVAPPPRSTGNPAGDRGTASGISYLELTTQAASAEDPLPLIVAIHGYGATPESLSPELTDLDVPARVVLPRGTERVPGAGYSWFKLHQKKGDTSVAGLDAAAEKLAVAIAEIQKTRPTRGKPMVMGFSQGGMLAFALATRFPELVSAAFPISGWLPPESIPERDPKKTYPKIMAFHGTEDKVLPIGPTRESVAKLKEKGFPVELLEYAGVGHSVTGPERERLQQVIGQEALRQSHK